MAAFDDFLKEVGVEVKALIAKSFKTVASAAQKDANSFIKSSTDDLKRWTKLLGDGSLTLQDFEFLLAAKRDLAEMVALKQAGLAQVQLDRFINGVVGAVIGAAEKTFL